ncbi:hypothetical protein [Planctomyces sp. SH-PL62]|uniref:hypothetical protein n=1 Tax=Planctomyces sp. SH-PL62 TaxID=1636152 RepID=UPI00078ED2B5|nr:hypothetical protein [Planctomyces sp. SH-PL62]AMV40995.1 hypothetical protein VT85_26405 [Planctomyces sp. SH-PL62]
MMTSRELRPRSPWILVLTALAIAWGFSVPARAQDAADVFDDAPAEKPAEKPEAKKDDAEKKDAPKPDAPKEDPAPKKDLGADPNVSDRDAIEFTQENVAAQMNELEERMFRLSEALRSLEPENASRLKLALKFSREELILQQMKDARKLLKDAQLSKAETEVREMLAKLEHLRRLLLAEDLDFQMKLARLRQLRETQQRLDRIITEERRELAWSRSAKEATEARPPKAEFEKFEKDQARNRESADSLASASSRLGNQGVALQKDLIRASGAMGEAEGQLSKEAADPAAAKQDEALKHLVKSATDLGKATEALLVELRSELLSRLLAELVEMHEIQVSIRETTEAQAPRVAQNSRTALLLVTGLAPKEDELAGRVDQLRALTEETEFGIALPTALRVIGRQMGTVRILLQKGDPTEPTVRLERRVEEDLLALAEALRRLPPSTPPKPGTPLPKDLRAREQELNRLIAELKMIRLLQSRLNDDTVKVDQGRPADALPPALRREIEELESGQGEIQKTLGRLADHYEGPAPQPEESEQPEPVRPE